MKALILSISLISLFSFAQAETMYCEAYAYKVIDVDNAIAEQPISKKVYKKISVDVTPNNTNNFYTTEYINDVIVTLDFIKLGISDSYELHFFTGDNLWTGDSRTRAVIYPSSFEDGKPGTEPDQWPFPGENKGYIYEYTDFDGGVTSLSNKVITSLKSLNLWSGRYSSRMHSLSSNELARFFNEDYPTLRSKSLITENDLVFLQLGACNKL